MFTKVKFILLKLFVLLLLVIGCSSASNPNHSGSYSVTIQEVYSTGVKVNSKEYQTDIKEIESLLKKIIEANINKDLSILKEVVHKESGLYVDLKAHWDYGKLLKELEDSDSYIKVYFYDKDKLISRRKDKNAKTVRDILVESGGIKLDLFFEDKSSCEVKIHFNKNQHLSGDLNNPYLIKRNNQWYLYRIY